MEQDIIPLQNENISLNTEFTTQPLGEKQQICRHRRETEGKSEMLLIKMKSGGCSIPVAHQLSIVS